MQRGGDVVRAPTDPSDRFGGDLSAQEFSALYDRNVEVVFGYLARRVGAQLAEELTAQTFCEAWAGRHRFDAAQGSFKVWVLGIASHLVARHWRSEARALRAYARHGADPFEPDASAATGTRVDSQRSAALVAGALAELRPDERTLVLLWAVEDLSYAELATALEIPVGTVRSRLSRARRRLATAIGLGDG